MALALRQTSSIAYLLLLELVRFLWLDFVEAEVKFVFLQAFLTKLLTHFFNEIEYFFSDFFGMYLSEESAMLSIKRFNLSSIFKCSSKLVSLCLESKFFAVFFLQKSFEVFIPKMTLEVFEIIATNNQN